MFVVPCVDRAQLILFVLGLWFSIPWCGLDVMKTHPKPLIAMDLGKESDRPMSHSPATQNSVNVNTLKTAIMGLSACCPLENWSTEVIISTLHETPIERVSPIPSCTSKNIDELTFIEIRQISPRTTERKLPNQHFIPHGVHTVWWFHLYAFSCI